MRWIEEAVEFPPELRPTVLTIGKFDGLHIGHRKLLELVRVAARERGCTSLAVTFDRHPFAVLAPERLPQAIVSPRQKRELFAHTGIDAVVNLPFTIETSRLERESFVNSLLLHRFGMRAIVIGQDFRFGHRGLGNVEYLRQRGAEAGFDVIVMPDATDDGEHRASSSRVRVLLNAADVRAAAAVLGRHHLVRGKVVRGAQRGRELGFPTANLDPASIEGFVPADAIYAGWMYVDGERYPAAISIGNNPTFDGVPQNQIEAHAIGEDFDLYGKTITLEFVDFVRSMQKFDTLDALIAQITADTARVRDLLGA